MSRPQSHILIAALLLACAALCELYAHAPADPCEWGYGPACEVTK